MKEQATEQNVALRAWLRQLLSGPEQSAGDYFERLRANVEQSAPVAAPCRP